MPARRDVNPVLAHHRARRARFVQAYGADSEAAEEAALDLKVAKLQEHIKKAVDSAPPLTDKQRRDLAALLQGGAA